MKARFHQGQDRVFHRYLFEKEPKKFNDNYELSLENYTQAIKLEENYFLALVNRADLYLQHHIV